MHLVALDSLVSMNISRIRLLVGMLVAAKKLGEHGQSSGCSVSRL